MPAEKQHAPAYLWYPKDYEGDEAVRLMTYEQEGIYHRLLDHQSLHGSIPADLTQIAALVPKISRAKFLKLWPAMAGKFTPRDDGRLVNPKLERVRAHWLKYQTDKQAAGDQSVKARRRKYGSAQPRSTQDTTPNTSQTDIRTDDRTESRPPPRTDAEPAFAIAFAITDQEKDRARAPEHGSEQRAEHAAERITDAFRSHWKAAYGHECTILVKPLEYMQLEQHLEHVGEGKLLQAMRAYFATDDAYVQTAKHPLAMFLRDPMRYLANGRARPDRPRGCKHDPPCVDDVAHTKRDLSDRKVAS